jgi:hypothetical protein
MIFFAKRWKEEFQSSDSLHLLLIFSSTPEYPDLVFLNYSVERAGFSIGI